MVIVRLVFTHGEQNPLAVVGDFRVANNPFRTVEQRLDFPAVGDVNDFHRGTAGKRAFVDFPVLEHGRGVVMVVSILISRDKQNRISAGDLSNLFRIGDFIRLHHVEIGVQLFKCDLSKLSRPRRVGFDKQRADVVGARFRERRQLSPVGAFLQLVLCDIEIRRAVGERFSVTFQTKPDLVHSAMLFRRCGIIGAGRQTLEFNQRRSVPLIQPVGKARHGVFASAEYGYSRHRLSALSVVRYAGFKREVPFRRRRKRDRRSVADVPHVRIGERRQSDGLRLVCNSDGSASNVWNLRRPFDFIKRELLSVCLNGVLRLSGRQRKRQDG